MPSSTPQPLRSSHPGNLRGPHTPENTATLLEPTAIRKRTGPPGNKIPAAARQRLSTREEEFDHGLQNEHFYAAEYSPNIAGQEPNYETDIYQRLYSEEVSAKDLASTTRIKLPFEITPLLTITIPNIKEASRPLLYITDQPEISTHERLIIVDWIIEVHMLIPGLVPESLYLCISIIDRYLSRQCVPTKRLQLLAITSLLIACKYEETGNISIADFTYFVDFKYTRQDIHTMELLIIKILDYRLSVPTGYAFLRRFLQITRATGIETNLASFYMERMLLEYSALELRPSHLAAAAVALALNNPDLPEHKYKDGSGWRSDDSIPGVVRTIKTSEMQIYIPPCSHFYSGLATESARLYWVFGDTDPDSMYIHRKNCRRN
jgi:hypothetical protein